MNITSNIPSSNSTYHSFIRRNSAYDSLLQFMLDLSRNYTSTHTPYLMTTRFNPLNILSPSTETYINYTQKHYNTLYLHLCSQLVKNFSRNSKQSLLPISFDFIDAPFSKQSKTIHSFSTVPHIHSIVFITNEQSSKFETLAASNFYHILHPKQYRPKQLSAIESIHAEPINHDLFKTLKYSSKLLVHPIADKHTLYTINPRSLKHITHLQQKSIIHD